MSQYNDEHLMHALCTLKHCFVNNADSWILAISKWQIQYAWQRSAFCWLRLAFSTWTDLAAARCASPVAHSVCKTKLHTW